MKKWKTPIIRDKTLADASKKILDKYRYDMILNDIYEGKRNAWPK